MCSASRSSIPVSKPRWTSRMFCHVARLNVRSGSQRDQELPFCCPPSIAVSGSSLGRARRCRRGGALSSARPRRARAALAPLVKGRGSRMAAHRVGGDSGPKRLPADGQPADVLPIRPMDSGSVPKASPSSNRWGQSEEQDVNQQTVHHPPTFVSELIDSLAKTADLLRKPSTAVSSPHITTGARERSGRRPTAFHRAPGRAGRSLPAHQGGCGRRPDASPARSRRTECRPRASRG